MNTLIQNILVFSALIVAVGFIIKKNFFNKPKDKGCGSGDDCGCH